MPYDYTFDATQYQPQQTAGSHPVGKFPAVISNTEIKPTKNGDGGMFVVEFETQSGRIEMRYNLWNNNQKAVDVAHKQLSALSYATGVFKLDMRTDGANIRGGRCMIEVGKQTDSEYTEVKRVYDINGNEPGKPATQPAAPAATLQQPAPVAPAAPQWGAAVGNPPAPVQQWGAPQQPPFAPPPNAVQQTTAFPSSAAQQPAAPWGAQAQQPAAQPAAPNAPPWAQPRQ